MTSLETRRLLRRLCFTICLNLGLALTACVTQPAIPIEDRLGALQEAAGQALSLGDLNSMETIVLQIMQLDPDNALAVESMGMLALRQNRLLIARDYLTLTTELDPGRWSAWNGLGIVADREEQHDEAQRHFLRGLALRPGHPQILANLGWSLLLDGRYEEAEMQLRASLQTAPEVATSRSNLALAIAMQGRYDEAQEHYLSLYSEAVTANNLGIAAQRRGDTNRAREFFQQAISLSPTFYTRAASNLQQLQRSNPTPVLVLP
ncbi:MAG: tetratricopeptide repeat protein [Pseudohongiella sp.]|uniref:tetratricopeptide repeat protein n=1 Tax=Pseudohongiella sp. TaxID=1979412 RepID=UPI00349FF86D